VNATPDDATAVTLPGCWLILRRALDSVLSWTAGAGPRTLIALAPRRNIVFDLLIERIRPLPADDAVLVGAGAARSVAGSDTEWRLLGGEIAAPGTRWAIVVVADNVPVLMHAPEADGRPSACTLETGIEAQRRLAAQCPQIAPLVADTRDPSAPELNDLLRRLAKSLARCPGPTGGDQEPLCELTAYSWMGRLARGLAHDFNNVLGGVLAAIELARTAPEPEEANESLDGAITLIRDSGARVRALLEAGRLGEPERRPLMPERPLERALGLVAHALTRKSIAVERRSEPAPIAEADEDRLTLLLARVIGSMVQGAQEGATLVASLGPCEGQTGVSYGLEIEGAGTGRGELIGDPELGCMELIAWEAGAIMTGPSRDGSRWQFSLLVPERD
jgi:signal transduction histidine kinase